ncbi:MAG: TonB-dependent receptor, partial [Candidatus Cloacimonadota bacterium]
IKKGEIDKAKGFLRKALDVESQNRWAKNILRNLEKKSRKSISGRVFDAKTGEGLGWVNIIVEGTTKGGISGNNGNFLIKEIEKGQYKLRFTRIGYADVIENLIVDSKTEPIFIGMESVPVMIQGITITASPVKEKKEAGQTIITPIELWKLPGSGAELFWGLKSLPGVSGGDIAPIVVRGGNSKENIVLLDGVRLEHPYHLESIGGGIISFFEPSILSNVTFTSGGFGAKYGNGLSSVVDVKTRSPRSSLRGRCSVSLANGYIGVEGSGFSNMNYLLLLRGGTTYLISNLSRSRDEFVIFPQYYDLFSKVTYQYNQFSKLEILGIGNSDVMKPRIDDSHTYLSKSEQKIISVRNRTLYKNGILRARISFVDFGEKEEIEGYYKNDSRDRKLDCEGDFEKKMGLHRIETGGGIEGIFEDMNGEFPDDSLRFLNSQSEIIDFSCNIRENKLFYFIQDEFLIKRRVTLVPGLRIEHITRNRETVVDPRFSLAYLLGRNTTLKLSTGIYHQSPQSTQDLMASNLPSEKAVHYVLGIEKGMKRGRVRLEGFYKTYENLPLKKGNEYVSDGFGYARGVDCLIQLSRGVLNGFFVYSFTDSERREMDADALVTSSYEIPHSFTISVTGDLLPYFSFGVKYRYHTGRFYTPVLCGRYDEANENWVPVFGEMNSARFPSYKRVDVQVSKIVSIRNNGFVLFAECENILGNENVVRYYYSQDFSEKDPLVIMNRTVVVGFMFYF